MSSPLVSLEPRSLWKHFDDLRRIPRPSTHEEKVIAHIKSWAGQRGFTVKQDAVGNLVVRVPATKGHEKAPIVILQGHMDIVAEKDKATDFDFLKDEIPVEIQGDWVVAPRTTLGADNGIGVATAMASADDPAVTHGPLELLFTVDEESALTGATSLDGSLLEGRTLLNLDSEEDGTLFVGCAGGCTTDLRLPLVRAAAPAGHVAVRVEVAGLKGGHSGLAIHENRGNSLKILARLLQRWMAAQPVGVISIEGGNKHNAIPREASAAVTLPAGFLGKAREMAEELRRATLTEIGGIDPGLTITVAEAPSTDKPADAASSRRLIELLVGLPHGVLVMSRDLAGLTETSTNLAIAKTAGDKVELVTSTRSSVAAALRFGLEQGAAIARLAGAEVEEHGGYPGWQPDMSSRLLKACREVGQKLTGKDPKVTAIHAGLECGLIGEKLGGKVDMISYGPQLEGVHAPGEKVNIPSVARFWDFHKAVLAKLAE